MLRLSLAPPAPIRHLPAFLAPLTLHAALVALLLAVQCPPPRWNTRTPLAALAQTRAHALEPNLRERNLALNFLANQRRLDADERRDFQRSGLSHLLAVSGGQLAVFLFWAARASASLGRRLFQGWLPLGPTLGAASTFTRLTALGVAILFSSLFGGSGALLRVAILTHLPRLGAARSFAGWVGRRRSGLPTATLLRASSLLLIAFIHGNPFQDLSFLLSAVGAGSVVATHWLLSLAMPRPQGILRNLEQSAVALVCTSFLVSLLLWPLAPAAPLRAAAANFVALPLVNFWITPLSLATLVWPGPPPETLLQAFDGGLAIFRFLAHAFANPEGGSRSLSAGTGFIHLSVCCLVLWSLLDAKEHEGIRRLRKKILPQGDSIRSRSSASVSTGIPSS